MTYKITPTQKKYFDDLARSESSLPEATYEQRVERKMELFGCSNSDAQGMVDCEDMQFPTA